MDNFSEFLTCQTSSQSPNQLTELKLQTIKALLPSKHNDYIDHGNKHSNKDTYRRDQ